MLTLTPHRSLLLTEEESKIPLQRTLQRPPCDNERSSIKRTTR